LAYSLDWPVDYRRGLVVVAHADDAEYGCSGTVARLIREGWDFAYVLCTDGSKGSSDPDMTEDKLSEIRRSEQEQAGKVLGLSNVAFLGHPDSYLQPTLELRKDIAREIRRQKPDVVICQYPMRVLDGGFGSGHPDHMTAGDSTLSAIFPTARDHMTFPELADEGFEPHKVAEAWIMGHPEPDLWVDISEHMEVSVKALTCHASQMSGQSFEEVLERMTEWRSERGKGRGMSQADSFRRIHYRR
jgi:LmbE family N-acetylglucosaminyl deacetylase